jgi:8-oxo-dGTP pyrophosphatase MutT (NUDIX family)
MARVRASGGVIWRGSGGALEILVVHRPRYDDWALPKGKREPGETDEECALREVEEETGFRCVLGFELAGVDYADADGRPKTVRYWAMTLRAGEFSPNSEVDAMRWLTPDAAHRLLTYELDGAVLDSFVARIQGSQLPT